MNNHPFADTISYLASHHEEARDAALTERDRLSAPADLFALTDEANDSTDYRKRSRINNLTAKAAYHERVAIRFRTMLDAVSGHPVKEARS